MPSTFCVPEIFLDANATTPALPEISQLMEDVCCTQFANPSSPHLAALNPKQILETTRSLALRLFNEPKGTIIFNSGATEGINTAVFSVLQNAMGQNCKDKVLLYGATEHKAVPEALKYWNSVFQLNAEVVAIPVDKSGQLDLGFIAKHLDRALIVCTMGANNETGVVADLPALQGCIRAQHARIPWLVDCVQVLGKVALDLQAVDVDYATFSAHKLYGPKGVGCLYVNQKAVYSPLTVGGGQEQGARGGTENVAGIAALGKIFQWLLATREDAAACSPFAPLTQLQHYRERLLKALKRAFPELTLNQPYPDSLPTTLNFSVPTLTSGQLIAMFDAAGIRVSAGSACSTGRPKSFVLQAMGLPDWQSEGAIRLSFGPATSSAYIEAAEARINALAERLDAMRSATQNGLEGVFVPQPTSSSFTVFAEKISAQSGRLYLFGHSDDAADWLATHFPAARWEYISATELTTPTWHLELNADQVMTIENRETQRVAQIPATGIALTDEEKQAVQVASIPEINPQSDILVDVRERLETAAQPVIEPYTQALVAPRAEWISLLLTLAEVPAEQRYITICRSGGRSAVVAALAAKLRAPTLVSAELGVTHLIQNSICTRA